MCFAWKLLIFPEGFWHNFVEFVRTTHSVQRANPENIWTFSKIEEIDQSNRFVLVSKIWARFDFALAFSKIELDLLINIEWTLQHFLIT